MKKNEPYLQMPVKETFLYGRLISGKSLGDVIYIKARRKYCFRLLLVFESGDVTADHLFQQAAGPPGKG